MTYWKTVEYVGAGFVLQRRVSRDGDATLAYDGETREYYIPERVIHINDAKNIDTETIDRSWLEGEDSG